MLRAVRDAEVRLQGAVEAARGEGETWARIGEALGISRQAAFQRFGRRLDTRSKRSMADVLSERAGLRRADAAVNLVGSLLAGRWGEARRNFGDRVARAFPDDATLASARSRLVGTVGQFQRMGTPRVRWRSDDFVVEIPMSFETDEVIARVSYGDGGKVVGLMFGPACGLGDGRSSRE